MNEIDFSNIKSIEAYKLFRSANGLDLMRKKLGDKMPSFEKITYDDFGVESTHEINGWLRKRKIAMLIKSLPSGTAIRCHTPEVGLNILSTDNVRTELTISWECNSINYRIGAKQGHYSFDSESSTALKLKEFIQKIMGTPSGPS